jgi:hypothetical protein
MISDDGMGAVLIPLSTCHANAVNTGFLRQRCERGEYRQRARSGYLSSMINKLGK